MLPNGRRSTGPSPFLLGIEDNPAFARPALRDSDEVASAPRAAAALRVQRLRRTHIRSRLVSAARTRHRGVGRFDGSAPRHVHGGDVSRQFRRAAHDVAAIPSASDVRETRDRHRCLRAPAAVRHAACRRRLHRVGGQRCHRHPAARPRRRDLSAAAHGAHGRDTSGDRSLGGNHAGRCVVARLLLRRQHRRRGDWQPAGGLLSPARVRHRDDDLCGRCAQCARRRARDRCGGESGLPTGRRRDVAVSVARPRRQPRLRRHLAVGSDGTRLRGSVDAAPVAAPRRDDLHVLADPRRVSRRSRHRQQRGLGRRAHHEESQARAGLVSDSALHWNGLDRLHAHSVDAILADQPLHFEQRMVPVRARSRPLCVCRAARCAAVGRQLSACACLRSVKRQRSSAARRRCLCREHARRHRRFARRQRGDGLWLWQPAHDAGACRHRRVVGPPSAVAREACRGSHLPPARSSSRSWS